MIISTIISILFFLSVSVFLLRLTGINPKNNIGASLVCNKYQTHTNEKPDFYELMFIFFIALCFRVLVFLASYAICGLMLDNIKSLPMADFLHRYTAGDAQHYIDIAKHGYGGMVEDGKHLMLVFFPLYPILIRIFSVFIPNGMVCALIISWLAFAFGIVIMYRLALMDYGKNTAILSIVLLSVSPFAFFFGTAMTESVFLLTAMLTFYAIRRHTWWRVGVFGMLCALSRSVGVLMIIPAFFEWYEDNKPISAIKNHDKKILKEFLGFLPVLLMIFGTLIYLFINYQTTGNPFIFLKYQSEHWHQNLQFFGKSVKTLADYATGDISVALAIFIPGIISALVSVIVILYSSSKTRLMYLSFMLVYFAYNAGASWPISLSRYLCCMFPAYFEVAEVLEKYKWLKYPIIGISAILFGIYFSGYLMWKQVM